MMLFDLRTKVKASYFDLHHDLWSLVVLLQHQTHTLLAWSMNVAQMNLLQHGIRPGKDR